MATFDLGTIPGTPLFGEDTVGPFGTDDWYFSLSQTETVYATLTSNSLDAGFAGLGVFNSNGVFASTGSTTPTTESIQTLGALSPGIYFVEVDNSDTTSKFYDLTISTSPTSPPPPPLTPNLRLTDIGVVEATVAAGGNATVSYALSNSGNGTAASTLTVYLSPTNANYNPSDIALATVNLGAISAGSFDNGSTPITLPSNLSAGTYYVGLIDNQASNFIDAPITVTAASTPDLLLTGISLSNRTVVGGGSTTVSYQLTNTGNGAATASTLTVYLSPTNATYNSSDTILTTIGLSAIGANSEVSGFTPVTLPSNLSGTYYVGLVDNDASNFTDTAITLAAATPDLLLTGISLANNTVTAGGSTTISYQLTNTGNGAATASTLTVYLSPTNATYNSSDAILTTIGLSAIGANSELSGFTPITVPNNLSAGTYYVGLVDNQASNFTDTAITIPAADVIMRDNANGNYESFDIGGNAFLTADPLGSVGLEWTIGLLGDFSSNPGESDMIIWNANTGELDIIDISNNQVTAVRSNVGQFGAEWSIAGIGDFSGNPGESDMMIRNANSGALGVIDISNNQITAVLPDVGQFGSEWSVAGFGDFSGNAGESDMMIWNANSGMLDIIDINNNRVSAVLSDVGQFGSAWNVAGFGDFSGNAGESDMMIWNGNTGALDVIDISDNRITGVFNVGNIGAQWQVAGFGNFSGDSNETGMMIWNANSGVLDIIDVSHNSVTAVLSDVGNIGHSWQVSGIAADAPAAPSSSQLAQAMASMAPASAALPISSQIDQPAAQPSPASLLATTNVPNPLG
jgi:hypothetical protein